MEKIKKEKEWYDKPNSIVMMCTILLFLIILMSQSFAVIHHQTIQVSDINNHNIVYIMLFLYFLVIRTATGKKFYNYLNLIILALYFLLTLASFLSIFSNIGIISICTFFINFLFFIYIAHVFLRDTKPWKELKLDKVPFDELSNSSYFVSIFVLSLIVLATNLFEAGNFAGVFMALLDCIFNIIFARYIYLYRDYYENKEKK